MRHCEGLQRRLMDVPVLNGHRKLPIEDVSALRDLRGLLNCDGSAGTRADLGEWVTNINQVNHPGEWVTNINQVNQVWRRKFLRMRAHMRANMTLPSATTGASSTGAACTSSSISWGRVSRLCITRAISTPERLLRCASCTRCTTYSVETVAKNQCSREHMT